MFCSKCGAQLPDNAAFCTACGTAVENGQPAVGGGAPQPLPPKKSKKGLIIGIIVAVVVVVAIVVAVLFGTGTIGGNNREESQTTTSQKTEQSQENEGNTIGEVRAGDWNKVTEDEDSDKVVINEFQPGTYGGVEFNSIDDVVNYYVKAYNYTKSLTAEYTTEDGSTATYYKLLGDEDLQVENVLVDGSSNDTMNSFVPTLVSSLFKPGTYGLVPSTNRDPKRDTNNYDESSNYNTHYDFRKSYLTVDDVLMANVSESDGKIVLQIQPKSAEMSIPGEDSQGRFFKTFDNAEDTIDSIQQLSWDSGTIKNNCVIKYKGGVGIIMIDPATNEITQADYETKANVSLTHANVLTIENKSVSVDFTFKNHYPASDEYLENSKNIKRK